MSRFPAAVAALLLAFAGGTAAAARAPGVVHIGVDASKALATTSDQFVCWNIDASANRGFFQRDLDVSKPYGKQLAYQAAHMVARQGMGRQRADAFSLLRFGGTGNDYLVYEFGNTTCPPPKPASPAQHVVGDIKCLNQTWWRNLLGFTDASNARIIFGISEPKWAGCGQGSTCGPDRKSPCPPCKPWDAANAREILVWTIAQNLDHLIYGFELGNEVDGMYTGTEQAQNLQILHNLTVELWPDAAKRPVLLGPDAAHQDTKDSKPPFPTPRDAYVFDFFKAAGEMDLPIAGATLHKYIEVTTERDTNASFLDETTARFSHFQDQVNNGWAASGSAKPPPRAWGGEVGPHNGGTPPCDHSSMRWATFADSLWYADALGSSAKLGFGALCRQDYIGADYGILDCATGTPLPDYWTATLWNWMVGPTVLSVTIGQVAAELESGGDSNLRVYAHCTAKDNGLGGGVTLIVLNLADEDVTVSVPPPLTKDAPTYMWQLAPEDKAGPVGGGSGLDGTGITLNGHPLRLIENNTYPSPSWGAPGKLMPDLTQFRKGIDPDGHVTLTPRSITFLNLEGGTYSACE